MPWRVSNAMSLRTELVSFMQQEGANVSELARRFGVSRKTVYKWARRAHEDQAAALADRSRRPRTSPAKTAEPVETQVVTLRGAHPAWGGRKLRRRLQDLGVEQVPAASTITGILHRNGLIDAAHSTEHKAFQRFEHAAPNDLWQMDFKGHFAMEQGRCHALTVLDDHSRYALRLEACGNEQTETVRERLIAAFRRYGLPKRMLMDNGSPWGDDGTHPYTPLTVWLLLLGVAISHGKPYHPQTQGKEERFHRTLKAEVLAHNSFRDLTHCQRHFDTWRELYNHQRPHEALGMEVPASRYLVSLRTFPEKLPEIVYAPDVHVRKVGDHGWVHYKGGKYRLPKAFKGYPIGLRPTVQDHVMDILFAHHHILTLDLKSGIATKPVTYVSAHLSPLTPV
jgi:transposase InsO family protein